MKITVNFSALNQAVEIMGAKRRPFTFDRENNDFDPIDVKLKRGFEVPLGDVDIQPGTGLLSVEGRQVLLYIQDHRGTISKAIENPSKGNKYHVAYCPALERMKSIGRYERYVVTNDTSGDFYITGEDWGTKKSRDGWVKLDVCKYCLSHLNYKEYKSNKWEVFKGFSLDEFFSVYQSRFKHTPSRKAGNATDEAYTGDWDRVSEEYRSAVGWGCEQCGVFLGKHKNLLHTHHISGVRSNNSVSNLKALCILCHSEQPLHGHMHVSFKANNTVVAERKKQGVRI